MLFENEIDHEEDLGKSHVIGERGYEFLKSKIGEMNKKSAKWGVPPIELKVIKEEFTKKTVFVNMSTGQLVSGEDPSSEQKEVTVKQYEIVIIGEPPRVDGYEFIAKVEHTPEGNILNYAPKASSKTIPSEYRTARQACDVCKTLRDRSNTFILKLEKDDPQRFPDKKAGDFVMIGSGCLKRFLPNISANALVEYAEMIEKIRSSINEAGEFGDFDGGLGSTGQGNYMPQSQLGLWLSAVYLYTGKFFSKKKASELQTSSTIDQVFSAMNSRVGIDHGRDIEDPVHKKMMNDKSFQEKANTLTSEFLEWCKTKDFDSLINSNPNFADFYNNLKVLAKQENIKTKNSGFFGALFATFLRDRGELEKKAAQKKASADFTYFGQVGGKIKVKVRINKIKEYESQYGRGLIITMEGEGSEIDTATGQSVLKKGNLLYFTSNFELQEGEEAEIEATVKGHQQNKFTQIPETQITRAKIVNFITHPEKNSGKTKVKDLSGSVNVETINVKNDWKTGQKTYFLYFRYDTTAHPDMKEVGSSWGIAFYYQIPDEVTYQSLKQYENKLVSANWSLSRSITLDKLKTSNEFHPVSKFTINQVLGDSPPNI